MLALFLIFLSFFNVSVDTSVWESQFQEQLGILNYLLFPESNHKISKALLHFICPLCSQSYKSVKKQSLFDHDTDQSYAEKAFWVPA